MVRKDDVCRVDVEGEPTKYGRLVNIWKGPPCSAPAIRQLGGGYLRYDFNHFIQPDGVEQVFPLYTTDGENFLSYHGIPAILMVVELKELNGMIESYGELRRFTPHSSND